MILIGNPDNRRTASLQKARVKLGLPPAIVIRYLDLLQGNISLTEVANKNNCANSPMLRIDAPGELFEVELALIALGAPDAVQSIEDDQLLPFGYRADPQPYSARTALALKEQKGKLYHPSQWFRGYGRLLGRLEKEAGILWGEHTRWLNAPADIVSMFDKRYTHQILSAAGIPVPAQFAKPDELTDYESLREMMDRKRMYRIFIKLASGSGACGVIAYQVNPRTGAEVAITSLGVENYMAKPPLYYNVKKLNRYSDQATIRQIINWLLNHGAHVEQWIAKAAIQDRAFDIRQLVVDGEACHQVARVSHTPITNLHLRSERMCVDTIGLSTTVMEAVKDCAESALAAFPKSMVAGVDVLLSSGSYKPYVVDVNPFGDLLYDVNYKGCNTYEWELKRLIERHGSPEAKVGSNFV